MKKITTCVITILLFFVIVSSISKESAPHSVARTSEPTFKSFDIPFSEYPPSIAPVTFGDFTVPPLEEIFVSDDHFYVPPLRTTPTQTPKRIVYVYVSNYGKIHRNSNCSGMKYYTKMSYADAINRGFVKCKKCY